MGQPYLRTLPLQTAPVRTRKAGGEKPAGGHPVARNGRGESPGVPALCGESAAESVMYRNR